MTNPQPSLFERPFDVQVSIVDVKQILYPEGEETNPAVEKPGVLQSVLLACTGNPELPYRVIDGKRRVRSAVKYGHATVPAIITDGSRGQIAAASAMLNAARTSNPLDEARNWKVALDEGQYLTVQDLARDMRVSVSTIKKRLNLLRLPESLLAHVGVLIADGVAERMANLDDKYLDEAIEAAERKLDQGEKFTASDLKNAQTRRSADQQTSLSDLFNQSELPDLFQAADPLAELVSEVLRLTRLRGVDLQALIERLQEAPTQVAIPTPVDAPKTISQPPATAPITVDSAATDDWLSGLVNAPVTETPAVEEDNWLSDLLKAETPQELSRKSA